MDRKINIFVIYTIEDKDTKSHLLRYLNPFKEDFNLSIWHEYQINSGQLWKPYIESHLQQTDIFLLLVSFDFMNSQFIKQIEFKAVIDRHKENKTVVIPVIVDNCQWDIDFILVNYKFNLNELRVLPEDGKPIGGWNSPDQAYKDVAAGVRKVITSLEEDLNQEESKKDVEQKATNAIGEDQEEISSIADSEAISIAEETISPKEEIGPEEENRLWEEAEAKRRAEVEKRILEEAEASAKRRAQEENRLTAEAEARIRAEEENRIKAAEAANLSADEETSRMEEAEAKRRAKEENRINAATAAANRRVEKETSRIEEAEAKRKAEEANRPKPDVEANKKVEVTQWKKYIKTNKIVRKGLLVTVLVVGGIWAFTVFNTGSEKHPPSLRKINAIPVEDSIALAKTKIDSLNREESFSKLSVGDTFDGGIIFTIDHASKTGIMAHPQDAGPMPWNNAMKIHEQLDEGWRLPTFDELRNMYQTIGQGATNSGQFAGELYWSATSYEQYQARLLRFRDGNSSYHYSKDLAHRKFRVRAVRDFSY